MPIYSHFIDIGLLRHLGKGKARADFRQAQETARRSMLWISSSCRHLVLADQASIVKNCRNTGLNRAQSQTPYVVYMKEILHVLSLRMTFIFDYW